MFNFWIVNYFFEFNYVNFDFEFGNFMFYIFYLACVLFFLVYLVLGRKVLLFVWDIFYVLIVKFLRV